ncbi:XkdF-like putative serine protease domain-containing protein [Halorussus vallis]|uniref:XkdF-like putative serine protease domain-containing protein n=1 Tax=Halorussus vallis TaxID=2953749 RepID=UPI0020A16611|nr:XkdF-like putative serine protease domain-containing protein [Halorussus vallis]USZ75655.1 XkdF-like putative serine protease domain-containing protein [Halorussus vallis]USZ75709.1 XkdF-like putative serine protease domain-containing protein [Halorussus vallis]
MPPVNKSDKSTLRKDVDFVAKDDQEQIATGIVMVPWAVDLQGDWERPETIAQFAEQFENFEAVGEAGGGVMHAVFPDEHASLERNEVLDEATDIGGTTAPEGAWVQSWKFEDEELWSLVDDGILEGYSIGAINVSWDGPMEQDELPDEVSLPDDAPEDALVWELVDGIIREVSAVDIPAVPDAQILETKADAEKRLADHLGNRDGFIEEAQQRGHSDDEAERLWEYLNRAVDVEGAGEPGSKGLLASAGKAFLRVLSGTDDDKAVSEAPDRGREKDAGGFEADIFRVVAPEDKAENYEDEVLGIGVDFPNSDVYVDWRNEVFPDELDEPHVSIYGSTSDLEQATGNTTEQMDTLNAKAAKTLFGASGLQVDPIDKEGRTLSTANRHRLYATIDASLDVLQDAGVDHGMTRFTDREDTTFDLSEHSARTWADDGDEDEDDENEDEEVENDKNAAGGDTPDDESGTETADDMTNENDTEPPSGPRNSRNSSPNSPSASTTSPTPTATRARRMPATTSTRWRTRPSGRSP